MPERDIESLGVMGKGAGGGQEILPPSPPSPPSSSPSHFFPYLGDFRQNLTYLIRNVQNPDDEFTGTHIFRQNLTYFIRNVQNPDDEFTGTHLFYQYFEANRK